MSWSVAISFSALIVSAFTFYWTSIRNKKAFYLVRIDNINSRMQPEFALINAGNTDILVTSILCSFENADGMSWEIPDDQRVVDGESSFSISPGKSHHSKIQFLSNFSEDFVKEGVFKKQGTLNLYLKDMLVIVQWVDSKGIEHKAEPKIITYGFDLNGHITLSTTLQKRHDLYKIISKR